MAAVTYTKAERIAIEAAFNKAEYLCSTTNWTDSPDWRAAYKVCRKDSDSLTETRYRMVNGWFDGVRAVDAERPMGNFPYAHTDWYVRAYILGIRHAMERNDHPVLAECRQLCPAAIAAGDAAQSRWLENKDYAK